MFSGPHRSTQDGHERRPQPGLVVCLSLGVARRSCRVPDLWKQRMNQKQDQKEHAQALNHPTHPHACVGKAHHHLYEDQNQAGQHPGQHAIGLFDLLEPCQVWHQPSYRGQPAKDNDRAGVQARRAKCILHGSTDRLQSRRVGSGSASAWHALSTRNRVVSCRGWSRATRPGPGRLPESEIRWISGMWTRHGRNSAGMPHIEYARFAKKF